MRHLIRRIANRLAGDCATCTLRRQRHQQLHQHTVEIAANTVRSPGHDQPQTTHALDQLAATLRSELADNHVDVTDPVAAHAILISFCVVEGAARGGHTTAYPYQRRLVDLVSASIHLVTEHARLRADEGALL